MINEISPQCLCQMKANTKVMKLLMGIRCHHKVLGFSMPEMMVTNNCCQVCQAVESALPEMGCILDVWHFIIRYAVYSLSFQLTIIQIFRYVTIILNSRRNMYHAAVTADITNVILKKCSVKGSGAKYWNCYAK